MKTLSKLLLILTLLGFPLKSVAKLIELPGRISLQLPENYKRKELKNTLLYAIDTSSQCYLAINTIDVSSFNVSKILESMDTICYNLSNMTLTDEESEWFFQWNKDYEKRYYENGKSKCVTYTFYSKNRPYCILFGYQTQNELETFEHIIDSIEYNGDVFDKIALAYKNAPFYWIVLFLLLGLIGYASHDDESTFSIALTLGLWTCVAVGVILIIPLWGSWDVLMAVSILAGIVTFGTSCTGMYLTLE